MRHERQALSLCVPAFTAARHVNKSQADVHPEGFTTMSRNTLEAMRPRIHLPLAEGLLLRHASHAWWQHRRRHWGRAHGGQTWMRCGSHGPTGPASSYPTKQKAPIIILFHVHIHPSQICQYFANNRLNTRFHMCFMFYKAQHTCKLPTCKPT